MRNSGPFDGALAAFRAGVALLTARDALAACERALADAKRERDEALAKLYAGRPPAETGKHE